MKKIGLVSVHNPNYGSMLQTYALHTFLTTHGIENEIILYSKKKDWKQFVRLFNLPLVGMKSRIVFRDLYCKLFYPAIKKQLEERIVKFDGFKRKYFHFSKNYVGWNELVTANNDYDTFIIGSDQVWNPINIGTDFFNLLFTNDDKFRISYASSFGVSSIPSTQIKKTVRFLDRIQCLSTREIAGVKIIKDLTGRDAQLVCDPTLLIDRGYWDELKGEEKFIKEKYIFCYFLGNNPPHRDFANRFKEKTGYKLVALQLLDELVLSDIEFADIKPFNVSPSDFINLVANAEYVLTDSFHGTIFSLLYHKPFFTFSRFESSNKISTNSRIESLLKMVRIDGRYIKATESIDDCLNRNVDFETVDCLINNFQKKSLNYIKEAIAKSQQK